jgi:hypothetical protein
LSAGADTVFPDQIDAGADPMPTRPTAPATARIIATVALWLAAAPSVAQTGDNRTSVPPANQAKTPAGATSLQSAPTRIDALDLSFFLPVGSVAETTSFGANATMGVELPGGLGVIVIKGQRSTDNELTAEAVADSMIEQLKAVRGVQDGATGQFHGIGQLVDRTKIQLSGIAGERFYIRLPAAGAGVAMVRGVSVFRTEPGRFIVFDLMSEAHRFEESRRVYETVVGTMEVTDRDALAARRAGAIERTQSLLAGLSADDLKALAGETSERWERLYTPARSGDEMDATEHGYRRVRVRWGVRGEVTGKPQQSWRAAERQPGLIVQLDAMALEPQLRLDTRAVYFVSEDFSEEAWTVKMGLRQDEVTTESSITGARSGTSMTVQLDQNRMAPTVTRPLIQGDGYVSQALTHLLAPLLVRQANTGEFAGYAYNTSTNTVSLRWDTVEQPADKPGLWIVRSRPDEHTPATTHVFNGKGELMRSELHNGRVWEPIELDRLVALWKRKGLPLE